MIAIIGILIGISLLIYGRRHFGLFGTGIGFLISINFVIGGSASQPVWLSLITAIIFGLVGAILAPFVQTAVMMLLGFLAGGGVVGGILRLVNIEVIQHHSFPVILDIKGDLQYYQHTR
jgi:hypothetical protein